MGKSKIKIERLESLVARQSSFSKRKVGIMKKTKEISILCDVDVLLLFFSPSGMPTLYIPRNRDIKGLLERYSQVRPRERENRKRESIAILKKILKKVDETFDTEALYDERCKQKEELSQCVQLLQSQLADGCYKWSCWMVPETVDNVVQIREMEDALVTCLQLIRERKKQLFSWMSLPYSIYHKSATECLYSVMTEGNMRLLDVNNSRLWDDKEGLPLNVDSSTEDTIDDYVTSYLNNMDWSPSQADPSSPAVSSCPA